MYLGQVFQTNISTCLKGERGRRRLIWIAVQMYCTYIHVHMCVHSNHGHKNKTCCWAFDIFSHFFIFLKNKTKIGIERLVHDKSKQNKNNTTKHRTTKHLFGFAQQLPERNKSIRRRQKGKYMLFASYLSHEKTFWHFINNFLISPSLLFLLLLIFTSNLSTMPPRALMPCLDRFPTIYDVNMYCSLNIFKHTFKSSFFCFV